MQTFLQQLNNNFLYKKLLSAWLSLLKVLENDAGWYIASIILFFVLINIEDKLVKKLAIITAKNEKNRKLEILQKSTKFFSIVTLLIVLAVSYNRFIAPSVTEMIKDINSPNKKTTPATTPSNSTTTPSKNTTPNTQTTPAPTTTKQLYYAVSCSSCWNQSCPRNGYSYGGYDYGYYYYYYNLCKACSCNDFKAQSLWR